MTKEQEEETIKYLEVLQKEYLEDTKRRRENGEVIGYGTVEDINKLRALYIGFALEMLKQKDKEIEKKDNAVRKIINRLNNDIERITKTKSDGKHCDDYSRCRLKAYKTKTREIKEYIEEQYFERKSEE